MPAAGPILRALLYKEVLRHRYHWGLFLVVGALLVLSALVSVGSRVRPLAAGAPTVDVDHCVVYASPSVPGTAAWAAHLRDHPPPPPLRVEFDERRLAGGAAGALRPRTVAVELIPPSPGATEGAWRARYWHPAEATGALAPYREWLGRETRRFLRSEPLFEEETQMVVAPGVAAPDRSSTMITALAVFALYLPSFTLYIATTGDEREKRLLLALLLTPATAAHAVIAKAGFYMSVGVGLALAVVGVYDPVRLLNPLLWSTFLLGALTYVAMGTLAIAFIRRQATLSTVSMLYLLATSSCLILASYLPLFGVLRLLFVEDYIYRQMQQIFWGRPLWWTPLNQAVMLGIALLWTGAAVVVVRRQGPALGRPGP